LYVRVARWFVPNGITTVMEFVVHGIAAVKNTRWYSLSWADHLGIYVSMGGVPVHACRCVWLLRLRVGHTESDIVSFVGTLREKYAMVV
jgi:hypothetical protein